MSCTKTSLGFYPEGEHFTHPWEFQVHDEFLSDSLVNYLLSLELKPPVSLQAEDMKLSEELIQGIRTQAEEKLGITEKLWFSIGLHHAPPHHHYKLHEDHKAKKHSCIVYLGDNGVGTILANPNHEYEVLWRDNRALYFQRKEKVSWHRFKSGRKPRLTLIMYWMTANSNIRTRTLQDYMTLPPYKNSS